MKESLSKITTDHELIKKWVEDRGGWPAKVKATGSGKDPGLLRIDFTGYSGEGQLEKIPWEDFFNKFDQKHLAFLYEDVTKSGKQSRFFKFVSRETVEARR